MLYQVSTSELWIWALFRSWKCLVMRVFNFSSFCSTFNSVNLSRLIIDLHSYKIYSPVPFYLWSAAVDAQMPQCVLSCQDLYTISTTMQSNSLVQWFALTIFFHCFFEEFMFALCLLDWPDGKPHPLGYCRPLSGIFSCICWSTHFDIFFHSFSGHKTNQNQKWCKLQGHSLLLQ